MYLSTERHWGDLCFSTIDKLGALAIEQLQNKLALRNMARDAEQGLDAYVELLGCLA
jgi:hypothetical protein